MNCNCEDKKNCQENCETAETAETAEHFCDIEECNASSKEDCKQCN